jgi:hypothetical protein
MVIVPTMQIAWTLFGITSGMLYFEEYLEFTVLSGAMFCAGVLVSASCCWGPGALARCHPLRPLHEPCMGKLLQNKPLG